MNAHAEQVVLDGIIGGQSVTAGAWPWQVSIGQGTPMQFSHFCGGALIDPEWVITAAHCVVNISTGAVMDPAGIIITAGAATLSDPKAFHSAVSAVIPHEQFQRKIMQNDVALLRLTTPAKCTTCAPIRLVQPAEEDHVAPPGTMAFVTGWGDTDPNPSSVSYSTQLMQVEVPIVSNAECASLYQPESITDAMVCAGWVGVGGKDSCQGDSGGPLVVRNNDGTGFVLEGMVSWGKDCANPSFPGVYTRASAYDDWANSKIATPSRSGGLGATDLIGMTVLVVAVRRRGKGLDTKTHKKAKSP